MVFDGKSNASADSAAQPLLEAETVDRGGDQEFRWNSRPCHGGRLHLASLHGDEEEAKAALANGEQVNSRFVYETYFQGNPQEGSGEAIHLAASRGNVNVVKLLLQKKASLTATVSRSHKPHYDVLHAAMFAEGRGGTLEMISYLFEARAELTRNQDGRWPIHVAFLTGNVPAINLLRTFMRQQNITDGDYKEERVPKPLQLGIRGGKMSEQELSDAAEITNLSMQIFIDESPSCIPLFLRRLRQKEATNASASGGRLSITKRTTSQDKEHRVEVARNLNEQSIAKVLREAPQAAVSLLSYATMTPQCEDTWHPLPTRVSFAARSRAIRLRMIFNPAERYLTEYQADIQWHFDRPMWKAPAWHKAWVDRSYGKPIIDANINVVLVPDLICAEVFTSLCDKKQDDLTLFDSDTIHVMTKHLFWESAFVNDLILVMLTLWGLAILIGEEVLVRLDYVPESSDGNGSNSTHLADDRLLIRSGHIGQAHIEFHNPVELVEAKKDSWVAFSWVACKSLVDLWLEYCELRGLVKIGEWNSWFQIHNLVRAVLAGIPSLLIFWPDCTPILLCGVFLYWARLLNAYTLTQYIGEELLPIIDLASGLGPSLFVTFIAFGAFTHAFYLVRKASQALWPQVSTDSFAVLITAALPERASDVGSMEFYLVLIAVLFFSVLIMNVFIGVICELYTSAKENAKLVFKRRRAESGMLYLLRSRVIPCHIFSTHVAFGIMTFAGVVALSIQVYCFMDHNFKVWVFWPFLACQVTIVAMGFQQPDIPWVRKQWDPTMPPHYLWFCKQKEQEEDSINSEIHGILEEMEAVVSEIGKMK
ncbi:unnamed protein product [Cladocopium goreaui]|uniref:Ion transport domain-containing protein n=1 Tax=Cladocopium goreaui TaxID=2562237 RepID=A0A9P1CIM1_9DINO|nr:unnamed protein product [Cladocopium goreaui]